MHNILWFDNQRYKIPRKHIMSAPHLEFAYTLANHTSLEALQAHNNDFRVDRPLLHWHNRQSLGRDELGNVTGGTELVSLLKGEIAELNGYDKEGFFAEKVDNRREDYRQQELSDLILFMAEISDAHELGIEEATIKRASAAVAAELEIAVVPDETPLRPVKAFNEVEEEKYQLIKDLLNEQAQDLERFVMMGPLEKKHSIETLFSIIYVAFYLLGVSPIRAAFEKLARNILKFPHKKFALPEGLSQTELRALYKTSIHEGKVLFDGEPDALGKSPQIGTRDFYGNWPEEIIVYHAPAEAA